MGTKIHFLFAFLIILLSHASCVAAPRDKHAIKDPPYKNFVKVFKELQVTKCKKSNKKELECSVESFYSTGSGLVVDIGKGDEVVVLSAGHVCSVTNKLIQEDDKFIYKWKESIRILNYNRKFYDAGIILSEQVSKEKETADLCSLLVPELKKEDFPSRVKISNIPPKIGEKIYYIGAPIGIYHPPVALITAGIFSGDIDKISSLTSLPSAQGASGSPILSMDGKIYGVLFAVHSGFRGATIITNYEKTKKFLLRTKKTIEIFNLQ